MQIVRDPADAASIADPEIRALVEKTVRDLSEDYPYDPDELGYFLIVEPGDSLDALNQQIGFPILPRRAILGFIAPGGMPVQIHPTPLQSRYLGGTAACCQGNPYPNF